MSDTYRHQKARKHWKRTPLEEFDPTKKITVEEIIDNKTLSYRFGNQRRARATRKRMEQRSKKRKSNIEAQQFILEESEDD